jgi:hypothetical protein
MSKKENIISDESLIAFIGKDLPIEESKIVENALTNDDKVFARFAILNQSIKRMNSASFEVTPDALRQKLLQTHGIASKSEQNSIFDIVLDKVNNFANILAQPGPAITVVSTACIVLMMIGPFIGDKEIIDNPKEISTILNRIQKKQRRMMSTSGNKSLSRNRYNATLPLIQKAKNKNFIVSIDEDNIIIEQKLKIARDLTIISPDESKVLNKRIKKIINTIDITEFTGNDSVRVVLETIGTVVYDDWIKR